MKKIGLIIGITGQDGSYLAELLLDKGYEVHGIIRRSSSINTKRIDHIFNKINLHYGDLSDSLSIYSLINNIKPHEIYNLGAQSHVKVSFDIPEYTGDITGIGALRVLESIRQIDHTIKYYQASSSELYGKVQEIPQTETTPFYPRSPYGVAKLYAYWITKNYRESYNMFTCNGILFNHESERRGDTFVTKKITNYVKKLKNNKNIPKLQIGNLDAKRDWGYAKDYVKAMWLMMQYDKPDDYVVATNKTYSIREFCQKAFNFIGIDNWEDYVEINPKYYRPAEVDLLIGDYSKIEKNLGWKPKTSLEEMIKIMINS